jgi:hypothetical protein
MRLFAWPGQFASILTNSRAGFGELSQHLNWPAERSQSASECIVHHPDRIRRRNCRSVTNIARFQPQYNLDMADRIACSCVTCPKCGTWVVVRQPTEVGSSKEKSRANCPAPECGKEFEFEAGEIRVFEISLPLSERRHFYGFRVALKHALAPRSR